MQATASDLKALMELQEVDIAATNAKRHFDELPQREQIAELAQKKQAVLQKLAQVGQMYDSAHRKCVQIEDEVAILLRKQDDTQAKIDEASGDYRAVQSLTRDLEGVAKRLATLDGEQTAAKAKEDQVKAVKAQVEQGIAALDAQAAQIRESFQREGGELQAIIADSQAKHAAIAAGVDAAVMKAYDTSCKRGGGIGVAELIESHCSICRNAIDDNRMLLVKKDAPLAECPSCHRLLIVQ